MKNLIFIILVCFSLNVSAQNKMFCFNDSLNVSLFKQQISKRTADTILNNIYTPIATTRIFDRLAVHYTSDSLKSLFAGTYNGTNKNLKYSFWIIYGSDIKLKRQFLVRLRAEYDLKPNQLVDSLCIGYSLSGRLCIGNLLYVCGKTMVVLKDKNNALFEVEAASIVKATAMERQNYLMNRPWYK